MPSKRVIAIGLVVLLCALTSTTNVRAADVIFTNPGAETGDLSGWTQSLEGGPWITSTDYAHSGTRSFISSDAVGSISRTIDLLEAGFTEAQLDASTAISISAWVRGVDEGSGVEDPYALGIVLRGEGGGAMLLHGTGWLTATDEWVQAEVAWSGYGPGLRLVSIEATGYDVGGTPGNYGAAFDDFAITITVDTTAPELTTISPADSTVRISPNTDLVLSFNEAVQAGSGNLVIHEAIDDQMIAIIPLESADGLGTDTITIDIPSRLRNNTDYYITIDEGALEDVSGNAFEGIGSATTWNFKTEPSSRTERLRQPTLDTNDPAPETYTPTPITEPIIDEPTTQPNHAPLPERGISPFNGTEEAITAVQPGDYVRGEHFDTVYYIDEDLMRHPILDAQIFFTWKPSFADVRTVTDATLSVLKLGSPLLPKSGTVLIKIQSVPHVFAIGEGAPWNATKSLIPDETTAIALFGADWADYVIDIPVTSFAQLQEGTPLTREMAFDRNTMKRRIDLHE